MLRFYEVTHNVYANSLDGVASLDVASLSEQEAFDKYRGYLSSVTDQENFRNWLRVAQPGSVSWFYPSSLEARVLIALDTELTPDDIVANWCSGSNK